MASGQEETGGGQDKVTFKGMWYEFTQITTFHGIHYITESTPYVIRRLIWMTIVGGVSAIFIAIIWNRAEKFSRHDKNVNVDVNFVHALDFPAVTICNQNYVRMTKTYEQGTYNTISSYFSDNGRRIRDAEENCRHRYVGQVGKMLNQTANPKVEFMTFAELTLDSCRRLCTDLPQVKCMAFSFNKVTRVCFITNVPGVSDWRDIRRDKFVEDEAEDVVTIYKQICNISIEDKANTRIGDGIVIYPRSHKDVWEHSPFTDDFGKFLTESSHQKEDMIHSCQWLGKPCSAVNFSTVMTDYGVCYSFNSYDPKAPTLGLLTQKTGSTFGLKLAINVEEYEYMPGPHHDSGIKMFLHDRKELPMVRDLGFAVPPGRHSLIDVKMSRLLNKEPPIGECGKIDLQYFSNYTWFRCWRDCETKIIVKECQCKAPFMDSATKGEKTPVCNMTHFFRCGIKAIDSADAANGTCDCVEPCTRVVYVPALSNAALSSLSIESILATKRDVLQGKHRKALNTMHRVKESRFLNTASGLLKVGNDYENFLSRVKEKTKRFKTSLIQPVVRSLESFIDIFQDDLNHGQFEGLVKALGTISLIYGPSRDTSYYLVDRVIRNSKLVSLHVQNLVLYQFFFSKLIPLTQETIEFAAIAEQTLPRYYQMVQDVNSTMNQFGFNYDTLSFPPERLAKSNNDCRSDMLLFYERLRSVQDDLNIMLLLVTKYEKTENQTLLSELQGTLSDMYVDISDLSLQYEHVKENCLEQFSVAVQDVVKFNKTFQSEAETHLDLDYTFDFEAEAAEVRADEQSFNDIKSSYLTDASITKQDLQNSLSEELFNNMIARQRALVVKIQFRLTERLRRRMDKARADGQDWYRLLIKIAGAIQEYMPHRFSEIRTRNLHIWKGPIAVVNIGHDGVDGPAFNYTYSVNTTTWRRRDFHREKALNTIKEIINSYFVPINKAIDEFDKSLGQLEQDLTTSIKHLRNLLNKLRSEEELTQEFIKTNFLLVDVYYSELRLQVISQLEAFSIEDLMGDVGGYMGLLLGASVVTVFEFLDVLIYGLTLKLMKPFLKRSKKDVKRDDSSRNKQQFNPQNGPEKEGISSLQNQQVFPDVRSQAIKQSYFSINTMGFVDN